MREKSVRGTHFHFSPFPWVYLVRSLGLFLLVCSHNKNHVQPVLLLLICRTQTQQTTMRFLPLVAR